MAATGQRAWSGRSVRFFGAVLGRYAAAGGAVTLSYQLVFDYLRHHDEANARPIFFDHLYATTAIGTGIGLLKCNTPAQVFCATFFSGVIVAPVAWWFYTRTLINTNRHSNIFYENGVTAE